MPKYSLLYDDNKLSLDQLENITYRLAYGHQIVCLPVSLPAPVYIAEEYAKRGRNLYRRYMSVVAIDSLGGYDVNDWFI